MKLITLIIILVVIIIFTLGYILYCLESMMNSLPFRVGYVSSNLTDCLPILDDIIQHYIPKTAATSFIEPGAGLSHVAHWAKKYQWKHITAIDLNLSLILLARLLDLKRGGGVQYVRKNIFAYSYPKNSLLYCYLREPILERMHQEGHFNGCLVVSLTFAIPNVIPTETKPLPGWQKRMYVYDFRTNPQIPVSDAEIVPADTPAHGKNPRVKK